MQGLQAGQKKQKDVQKKQQSKKSKNDEKIAKSEETSSVFGVKKEKRPILSISFSSKGVWKFWGGGIIAILGGYVLYIARDILPVILTGILLAIAMESTISFLSRFMRRGWAIFIGYSILFTFLILGFISIVLFIPPQVSILVNILTNKAKMLQNLLQTHTLTDIITACTRIPEFLRTQLLLWIDQKDTMQLLQTMVGKNINTLITTLQSSGTRIVKVVSNIIGGTINILFKMFLITVIAIMGSVEKEKIIGFFESIENKDRREYWLKKVHLLYSKIGLRFHGQFLLCVIIGVATRVGLMAISVFGIHISHIPSLAFIAGLTEIIPYIGPVMGALPALLVATTSHGLVGFAVVLVLFVVIQQVENNLIIPRIMKKQLGISPIVILVSILLGGTLRGFLGVLLAVPCALFLIIFLDKNFK